MIQITQVVNARAKFKFSFSDTKICGGWDSSSMWNCVQFPEQASLFHSLHKLFILPEMFFLIVPLIDSKTFILQDQISCVLSSVKLFLTQPSRIDGTLFLLPLVLVQTAQRPLSHDNSLYTYLSGGIQHMLSGMKRWMSECNHKIPCYCDWKHEITTALNKHLLILI